MTSRLDDPRRRTTADRLVVLVLIATGLVHLAPAIGVLGGGTIERLYGIDPSGTDVALLLQHRAVLFGILGAGTLAAAATGRHRTEVLVANLVSVATFVLLFAIQPATTGELRRVATVDAVLVLPVAAALVASARTQRHPEH